MRRPFFCKTSRCLVWGALAPLWLTLAVVASWAQSTPPSLATAPLPAAPPAAAAEIDAEARAVVERHLAAVGGKEARKSARFVDTVTEVERSGVIEKGRRVEDRQNPQKRRFYNLQEGASGKIETGFDGERAWRRAPFFRGFLDENDAVTRAARQPRQELSEFATNGMSLRKLPDEEIEGQRYQVVLTQVEIMGRKAPMKFFFDAQSGLLTRTEQGDAAKVITTMSDFRPVQGRLVAFVRHTRTPQTSSTTRTKSVEHLDMIDESIFELAPGSTSAPSGAAAARAPADTPPTASQASPSASRPSIPPSAPASAPAGAPPRAPDHVMDEATKMNSFQMAWKTINDSYWDQTFHGVDWAKVREKYSPLIAERHTNESFHMLLNRMLGELGRSHLRVTSPHLVNTSTAVLGDGGGTGTSGLDMRLLGNELVVVKVDADAGAAGSIRVGEVIESINGKSPTQLWEVYRKAGSGFVGRETSGTVRAARAELSGALSEQPALRVRNAKGDVRTVSVARKKAAPRELAFESKRLDGQIGYVRFNLFLGDLAEKFKTAMREHQDAKGLIVDLRGNGGGIGDLSTALANMLSRKAGTLGESRFRYETRQFAYAGSADAYDGKVVFLVDEFSASTSEVLAGGLQQAKRILVVGEPTAGAVLPSIVALLPSGGAMQYAISDFRLADQRVLEGAGVTPDEVVVLTREDVVAGRDPVLAKAVARLTR